MKFRSKLLLVCGLFLFQNSFAQEVQYHLTIPSTPSDTIDLGPVSWYAILYNRHLFIENTTDEPLILNKDIATEGFRPSDSGRYSTFFIEPHSTRRLEFYYMVGFDRRVVDLYVSSTNGAMIADYHIPIKTSTDDSDPDRLPLRDNQYVAYPIPVHGNLDTSTTYHGTYFNSSDSVVNVYGAFVIDERGFKIVNVEPHYFPLSLLKAEEMRLNFRYDGRSNYDAIVIIVTDPEYNLTQASYKDNPGLVARPLAVHEHAPQNALYIYPNPADEQISWTGNDQAADVNVMDVLGKIVLKGRSVNHLNISELPPGIYTLTTSSSESVYVGHFLVR